MIEMKKGKRGQGRKKAPSPEVDDEVKDNDEDDEMQLKNSAKVNDTNNITINSSSMITPSLPSTALVTKECDGSISTSNDTNNTNSRIRSTVQVENSIATKLLSESNSLQKKVYDLKATSQSIFSLILRLMLFFVLLQNISILHADLLLKSTIWIQQHVSSFIK